MAPISTLDVRAGDYVGKLTIKVNVTGLRRAKVRLWLATKLCGIAARIAGTGFSVTVDG